MMRLDAALAETLPLFEAAGAGATPLLPVAQLLCDSVLERLARAQAIVRADLVAPINRMWLPDDVIGYIFEFVVDRRTASRFGAGGTVVPGTTSPTFRTHTAGEATQLRALRRVCKKWARLAGVLVCCLSAPRPKSRMASAEQVFSAFPRANALVLRYDATSAQYWGSANDLIKRYTARDRPFCVNTFFLSEENCNLVDFSTAFYYGECGWGDADERLSFMDSFPGGILATCPQNTKQFKASMKTSYPMDFTLFNCILPSLPRGVANIAIPQIFVGLHQLEKILQMVWLFDKRNWLDEKLPLIVICGHKKYMDLRADEIKTLVSRVGAENIKFFRWG